MARYIDADKLIAEYDRVHVGPAGGARKLMVEAPTADVVPRAEAENYKSIAEHQQKLSMDRYFEIKQLKQELDELKLKYNLAVAEREANVRGFSATVLKHKAEVAREIFEEIESVCLKHIDRYDRYLMCCKEFAELKKKYTEGEK